MLDKGMQLRDIRVAIDRVRSIISGLQDSAVPVAPALGSCDDVTVNGAPFYVMGFVDGHVVRDRDAAEATL